MKYATGDQKLRRKLKSFIGSRLRVLQTRFDVAFATCKPFSDFAGAANSISALKLFLADSHRILRRVANQHLSLPYVPLFRESALENNLN